MHLLCCIQVISAVQGVLIFSFAPAVPSPELTSFTESFRRRTLEEYGREIVNLHPFALHLYNTVLLFAHATGKALKLGVDHRDGRKMVELVMPQVEFDVFQETFKMDLQGNRKIDFAMFNVKNKTRDYVARYSVETGEVFWYSDVVWPGNTTEPPQTVDLVLGVLIPSSGGRNLFNTVAAALPLAIEAINANTSITGGLRLGFEFGEDPGCSGQEALGGLVQLLDQNVRAIIGPVSS